MKRTEEAPVHEKGAVWSAILSKLQLAGLKLKLGKCHIGVPSVTYLGYKLDKQDIHPTEDKVKAISEAPAPTNITQLRAYLGVINF